MHNPTPTDYRQMNTDYPVIERAIRYLEEHASRQPELGEIASAVGLSEFHFQRVFTRWAGISPKRFLQFLTKENAKELLDQSENLLDTTLQVGLSSLGRLHDLFITTEAVTPGEYKNRGEGLTIHYGLHPTPFGQCLIGVTERGICHLGFTESSEGGAVDELAAEWHKAKLIESPRRTESFVEPIFNVGRHRDKPLQVYLRGTNFQIKVWEALLRIPLGSVSTYQQIAEQVGRPRAVRAVGTAVGHNPIPVLIPCHRVIRKLGEFGNYHYGTARKKAMLGWELSKTQLEVV